MKYFLAVSIDGETEGDLVEALREVTKKVDEGYVQGSDSNDTGSYYFQRIGS